MGDQERDEKGRFAAAQGASVAATKASNKADAMSAVMPKGSAEARQSHFQAAAAHQNAAAAWRSHATLGSDPQVAENASFHTSEMLRHGAAGGLPGPNSGLGKFADKHDDAPSFQKTNDQSREAMRASMDASKSGKASDHQAALQAHTSALATANAYLKVKGGDKYQRSQVKANAQDHAKLIGDHAHLANGGDKYRRGPDNDKK